MLDLAWEADILPLNYARKTASKFVYEVYTIPFLAVNIFVLSPGVSKLLQKNCYSKLLPCRKVKLIGETRFELATSASRTQRSGQTELLPGKTNHKIAYVDLNCKLQ
jgi:hypothetical protein